MTTCSTDPEIWKAIPGFESKYEVSNYGKEILHADGNPANNKLENLRYGTRSENILDVFRVGKAWRKLTVLDVLEIKRKLKNGAVGADLAKEFNVSQSEISAIKNEVHYSWL